jgi:hypothetical protein
MRYTKQADATPGDGASSMTGTDTEQNGSSATTSALPGVHYTSTADLAEASVFRPAGDAEDQLETSQGLARKARDSFRAACHATEPDRIETNFLASRYGLQELWDYATVRNRAFRDLLAALDAAVRYADFAAFSESQRTALNDAFDDLPKMFLEGDQVRRHLDRFAAEGIDILGPLRSKTSRRVEVTFREIG